MTRAAAGAAFAAFVLVVAACDTSTDVVLGSGDGGGGSPTGGVNQVREPGPQGSGGTGGGASSAVAGTGGAISFPVASGGQSACAAIVQVRELRGTDFYVLLDQSESMNYTVAPPGSGTWWQAVQEGFSRLVNDPGLAGSRVGLQFLPLGGAAPASCTADYAALAVPVGPLPDSAAALVAAVEGHAPTTTAFTPLGPALAGLIAGLPRAPAGTPVVLVVTDGFPTECEPGDLAGIAAIVRSAHEPPLGVKTHVLGVNLGDAATNLDPIAEAGGTEAAMRVSARAEPAEAIYQAMRSALRTPIDCQWLLPSTPAGASQPLDKTQITFRGPGAPEPQRIPYVESRSGCDGDSAQGWFVQRALEHSTQFVVLCPRSCAEVQSAEEVKITIECRDPVGK